jgi:predicted amidohydrolase
MTRVLKSQFFTVGPVAAGVFDLNWGADMKIAAAQSRPVIGPVEGNLAGHQALINLAIRNAAQLVVFPELSLTGYEPARAASLTRRPEDPCFAWFQTAADENQISIAVGAPTSGNRLPRISTLLFRPGSEIQVYSKQYLHTDEEPFFEPGAHADSLIHRNPRVALAICYELSVPAHAQQATESCATVYVASVAKTYRGIEDANQRPSVISSEHSMVTLMANCLGLLDGAQCEGRSSAWSRNGNCLITLGNDQECVIVVDDETEAVVAETLPGKSR